MSMETNPELQPLRSAAIDRNRLARLAESNSLLFLGTSDLQIGRDLRAFGEWLAAGKHAGMTYLEQKGEARADFELILPGTRSVWSVAVSYAADKPPGDRGPSPVLAGYAGRRDYHRVLRERCERFVGAIRQEFGLSESRFRITVDTAPVLERALAARTVRGFIGKNACFIHPEYGSFLLLAEIFTDVVCVPDRVPEIVLERKTGDGGCGPCDLCQRACPTGALDSAYSVDARKCLSYWTIEHRGVIPVQYWPHLKQYWFGCDLCQDVCPYNVRVKDRAVWTQIEPRALPGIFETAVMNESDYQRYFGGTPLTRAKRSGLRRNAFIAMAVTQHPGLSLAIDSFRRDPQTPLLRTLEQWEMVCAND